VEGPGSNGSRSSGSLGGGDSTRVVRPGGSVYQCLQFSKSLMPGTRRLLQMIVPRPVPVGPESISKPTFGPDQCVIGWSITCESQRGRVGIGAGLAQLSQNRPERYSSSPFPYKRRFGCFPTSLASPPNHVCTTAMDRPLCSNISQMLDLKVPREILPGTILSAGYTDRGDCIGSPSTNPVRFSCPASQGPGCVPGGLLGSEPASL
jgi:hypothetical protein